MVRLLLSLVGLLGLVSGNRERWGKIEHGYTFRKPIEDHLPFWQMSGSCFVDNDLVKFAPQSQKRSGHMWNKQPTKMTSWEVVIEFSVSGIAPVNTGEGLAFWHAASPGAEGAVYGHTDRFNGLGIFFDSYDSDDDGVGEAYVLAMANSGEKAIDDDDGGRQLGVCFVDYRNLPDPPRAKISYTPDNGGHLTIGLDTSNSGKYRSCISVKDVVLDPETQHFGFTVADYGNDFTINTITGINTSERFEPIHQSEGHGGVGDAVLPEESTSESETDNVEHQHHHTGSFSDHHHFEALSNKLHEIDNKLLTLEDEFSKKFASFFHNHNTHFQHYISNNLQLDLNSKHEKGVQGMVRLGEQVTNLQHTIEELRLLRVGSQGGGGPPKDAVDLTQVTDQVKSACVEDPNRGQNLIAQLKENVAALRQKQDGVLTSVRSDLLRISSNVQTTCGEKMSFLSLVVYVVVGAVVGVGVGFMTKPESRHKRW